MPSIRQAGRPKTRREPAASLPAAQVCVPCGGRSAEASALPPHLLSSLSTHSQGTQSTRFFLYDRDCRPLASAQVEFPQIYPRAGYVLPGCGAACDLCCRVGGQLLWCLLVLLLALHRRLRQPLAAPSPDAPWLACNRQRHGCPCACSG